MKVAKFLVPFFVLGIILGNIARADGTIAVTELTLVGEQVARNNVDQHHHHHGHGHHHHHHHHGHHHHFGGVNANGAGELPAPQLNVK